MRLLEDPLMVTATAEIDTQDEDGRPKPRMQARAPLRSAEEAPAAGLSLSRLSFRCCAEGVCSRHNARADTSSGGGGDTLPSIQVAKEIKAKERARDILAQRYASSQLSQEQILHCLYSVGDNNNYLRFNRDPIDR